MKCYKPNDLQPGDVVEHDRGCVMLVLEINRSEMSVKFAILRDDDRHWTVHAGTCMVDRHNRKSWKRFNSSLKYITRGWEETLRLKQEHASPVEHDTMTK